jgi:5-methylcytosine-specific restriction endonuclease McrA
MCPACKLPLPEDLSETEIDHIIPRARGGPNLPWNKQLVHFKCNRSKWTRLTPEAEALAVEHGVRLHLPIPSSAHANRPITRDESLQRDWWSAISEDRYRSISERLAG